MSSRNWSKATSAALAAAQAPATTAPKISTPRCACAAASERARASAASWSACAAPIAASALAAASVGRPAGAGGGHDRGIAARLRRGEPLRRRPQVALVEGGQVPGEAVVVGPAAAFELVGADPEQLGRGRRVDADAAEGVDPLIRARVGGGHVLVGVGVDHPVPGVRRPEDHQRMAARVEQLEVDAVASRTQPTDEVLDESVTSAGQFLERHGEAGVELDRHRVVEVVDDQPL